MEWNLNERGAPSTMKGSRSRPIPRQHLSKWYHAARHGAEQTSSMILDAAQGADVLDYGCGAAWTSLDGLDLPGKCRSLTGIDISDVAVAKATERAARYGAVNARFLEMDAQATTFAGQSFDLIFGFGILHHLDLEKCWCEIARILRPRGVAIFTAPMGHNPIINLYRRRTPELRTPDAPLACHRFCHRAHVGTGALSVPVAPARLCCIIQEILQVCSGSQPDYPRS
jgi:SAM-dependent methyltransferase